MKVRRYRPKRRLRSEIVPLALILSLPLALYLAFPSGAVGFRPAECAAPGGTYQAFVSFPPETETALLTAARASWQSDSASRRGVRANLLSCGAAADDALIASGIRPPVCGAADPVVDYECDLLPAGVAAGSPALLKPAEPSVRGPVFTKADLLKLN